MDSIAAPSSAFLTGGGTMGKLIRSFDWSATAIGSMEQWPQSLRISVQIMLNSRFPMFIWWGDSFLYFYNDAYMPTLGVRHPGALGKPAMHTWTEIWEDLHPQVEAVVKQGEASWNEELLLFLERSGFKEETYHTFSYSPIPNDTGGIGGLYCAVMEVTPQVINRRRLQTLRDLGERGLTEAKNTLEACRSAAQTLLENPKDLPFTLIYLLDKDVKVAELTEKNLPEGYEGTIPARIEIGGKKDVWHFQKVLKTHKIQVIEQLEVLLGRIRMQPWEDAITQKAIVLPLAKSGMQEFPAGFLVVGISPRLSFDQDYQSFIELVAGHIATAIDNARTIEEERKRAKALAELDHAKTVFFSNVSHEFRTPLTLMLGPLEEVINGQQHLASEQQENLKTAHRNAMRLLKLVNTLLDFSRIEANRIQASYEPHDLATLTQELTSNFRSAIEKAEMQLITNCVSLGEPVYVDREMWEKIVLNLLSNAFKYTLEGTIEVTLKKVDNNAVLSIKDSGVGIPATEIENIFKRFHRVQNVQGRTHEGTGIGLSLVQELVHLHRGTIRALSEPHVGSTFIVTIPLGKAHLSPEQVAAPKILKSNILIAKPYVEEALRWLPYTQETLDVAPDKKPRESLQNDTTKRNKPCVLLVDDNADMRDYVEKLLHTQFEVTTAKDGYEALQQVAKNPPDLILSDIMMPRMDGIELLKHLKQNPQTRLIPVILLSARAGEEAQIDGLEAGADDYLVKPFSAKELLTRVQTHLSINAIRLEAERRLRNMILQAPMGIAILKGPDFVFEMVNDNYLPLVDKSREQLEQKAILDALPELEGQPIIGLLQNVVATGEPFFGNEYPVVLNRFGNADKAYFNFVYQPLLEADGSTNGIMAVATDVTEQVLSRKKVEESEGRYRILFESMDQGFCVCEMLLDEAGKPNDYRFLEINPTFEQQTGLKNAIGKTARELVPNLEDHWFELYGKVALTGESIRFLDGSEAMNRWFDVYAYHIGEADSLKFGILFSDITERKQAETALRKSEQQLEQQSRIFNTTLSSITDFAYTFDQKGRFIFINQPLLDLWGLKLEEAVGKNFHELDYPEELATKLQEQIQYVFDTKNIVKDETPYTSPSGEIGYYEYIFNPVFANDETVAVVAGSTRDITERKRAEEKLRFLVALNQALLPLAESEDIMSVTARMLGEHLHVNRCAYAEVEADENHFHLTGNYIHDTFSIVGDFAFSSFGEEALRLMRANEPYIVNNVEQDLRTQTTLEIYHKTDIAAVICLPLHKEGRFTAAMAVHQKVPRTWTKEEIELVGLVVNRCWEALERTQVLQNLRESHQFNQDVLDSLPEHIAVLDKTGSITAINQAWRRFALENGADWTMKGVGVGTNYLHVCDVEDTSPEADDARAIYQGLCEVLGGTDKFFSLEYPCNSPKEKRWFLLTVSPLTHGAGGAVVSHLNITSRRLAEEALRESAERLRMATESAELGTWDFNPITKELVWDQRTKALFGLSPGVEINYNVFLQGLHPDDRQMTDEAVKAALRRENEGAFDIEYRTQGIEDQKSRWIRAKGEAFFDAAGNATRFIGTVLDVTKAKLYEENLKESEALFRKLADDVPVKIWMTQPDGTCTYLNKQWYNYTGQTPEEALGFGWLSIVHPDDAERAEKIFLNANQQHISFSFEYRLRGKDGTYRWKLDAGSPRFEETGEFEGFIGMVVDIHERKLAEEQKDAFMRIAGHELRTPLTSLVGYLSLMLKAPDNLEMVTNFAKKSYNSALKMRGLISDFLDFSRAQQGDLSFNVNEFDFDTLVNDTVENMQLSYPQHRILLQGHTQKKMEGDYGRIEQVITNLLHNAVKYSPGKDRIEVILESKEDKIVLKVKDYGVGIDDKELDKIFGKFHRASNTGKIKGMGLGLYIVKQIVDFHQGSIWVESTPNQGALFIVEFPAI